MTYEYSQRGGTTTYEDGWCANSHCANKKGMFEIHWPYKVLLAGHTSVLA